jgi:two-component system, NarL family, response regulator YdfI
VTDRIRVLVADDHALVREGLRLILETEPDFELVAEAGNGAEAVELAAAHRPDVILMDLRMPELDGLEAIARIRRAEPDAAIVILTTYNEDDLMRRGLQAGARGYLLKDTDRETLFRSIRAAAGGETLLQPEMLTRLLSAAPAASASPGSSEAGLTERERQVLDGVARGERSKEIAVNLGITERTVKAHLASIYNKLGVDSRAAAISAAVRRGWLPESRKDL